MKKRLKLLIPILSFSAIITLPIIASSCSDTKKDNDIKNNVIVNELSINKLNIQKLTKLQFYNAYFNDSNKLNKLISENLSFFVKGPIEQIKNNFESKIKFEADQIIIELSINAGYWYKNNKLDDTSKLTNDVLLSGFSEELNPDEGGKINNLSINNYLKLVDVLLLQLNINSSTNISSLDNEKLNEIYKKSTLYNNLVCNIENGSNTQEGLLKLKINGTFENKKYTDVIVSITGFNNPNQLKNKSLFLGDIKLNLSRWFENLQPTVTVNKKNIEQITSNDFYNKYIESGTIMFIDNFDLKNYITFEDAKNNGYTFEFGTPNIRKDNFILYTTKITNQPKQYLNNQWVNSEIIDIKTTQYIQKQEVTIPTNNDSLDYLLNTTTINESILANSYASYFKALAINAKKLNNVAYPKIPDFIQNNKIQEIKNTYFSSAKYLNVNLSNDPNSFNVNDFNPQLDFSLQVSIDDGNPIKFKPFSFTNKTKNLSTLMENILSKNNVINLRHTDSTNWGYKLIKNLKKSYLNQIEDLFQNREEIQNLELDINLSSTPINSFMSKVVYSNDGSWRYDNVEKIVSETTTNALSIFGINVNYIDIDSTNPSINLTKPGDIDINSGLFKYDNDNIFMINNVYYEVGQIFKKMYIYKQSNSQNIYVSFPFETTIDLEGRMVNQNSKIGVLFSKEFWDRI